MVSKRCGFSPIHPMGESATHDMAGITAVCAWPPSQPAVPTLARVQLSDLGVCAAEGVEAKRVGKERNLRPLLKTVAEATARKTGAKWDFSPRVAADALLPRSLLG